MNKYAELLERRNWYTRLIGELVPMVQAATRERLFFKGNWNEVDEVKFKQLEKRLQVLYAERYELSEKLAAGVNLDFAAVVGIEMHDYIRRDQPQIKTESKCARVDNGMKYVSYSLPSPRQYIQNFSEYGVASQGASIDLKTYAYGDGHPDQEFAGTHVYAGYAPEIDTIFYWIRKR